MAVSGGIDSVALLRLVLELRFELGIVLSVVHFNHKLRGAESDADEEFVRNLAREHDLEFYVDRGDVAAHAREEGVSVETAARQLRYEFLRSLIRNAQANTDIPTSGKIARPWGTPTGQVSSGAKAPLSLEASDGTAESRALSSQPSKLSSGVDRKSPPLPQQMRQGRGNLGVENTSGAKAPLFLEAPDGEAESRALSKPFHLDKIATGHTLDDQAETVLMRMIRGSGMRGLGAIYPRIEVEDDDGERCGEIVRPLLETRRCELASYLKEIDQSWREDSTNADHHFTRNRVRKLLVPLLEKEFNPKIAEGLAELAEIAREEEDYWENEVAGWMGTAVHWSEPEWMESHKPHPPTQNVGRMGQAELVQIQPAASPEGAFPSAAMNASVDRLWFLGEPVAVQRRLVKAIAEEAGIPLEFRHVEEILRFAAESGPSGKELALPLACKLVRESEEIIFVGPDLFVGADSRQQGASVDYEYSLPVPGRVLVNEIDSEFEARIVEPAGESAIELDALLLAEPVPDLLTLRNWRAGDRFWPAHTKSPKKIKELLTDLHVAHTARAGWPVIASGGEIVWVRGFPVSSKYRARAGGQALLIRETPLSDTLEK